MTSMHHVSEFVAINGTNPQSKLRPESGPNWDHVGTKSDPSGDQVLFQPPTQSPTQSDNSILRLLLSLQDGEKSSSELRNILNIKHRPTFRDNYLHPALDEELIEMTIPEKPTSRLQKYRTPKGRNFLSKEVAKHDQ